MTASDTKAAAAALLGLNRTAPRAVRLSSATVKAPSAAKLSDEQEDILGCTDQRIVITALAGAGKSRVLAECVRRAPHRPWSYLAFNKSMAVEASALMPKASCRTVHSLAFSAFGKPYSEKCNLDWTGQVISKWCAIPPSLEHHAPILVFSTIERFAASADDEVQLHHIPLSQWKKFQEKSNGGASPQEVVAWATRLWMGMVDLGAPVPMTLDGIVKLMHLARFVPKAAKNAGFLVDEAQDLTPCVRSWIDQLPYQVIRAGDPYQSIYGWRMQGLSSPWVGHSEKQMWLCGSWRFGPAVAELVNPLLSHLGCPNSLIGMGPDTRIIADPDEASVLLSRTRAGLIAAAKGRIAAGATLDYTLAPWLLDEPGDGDFEGVSDEDFDNYPPELEPNIFSQAQSPAGQKVMTAHASKGASFSSVMLAEDFEWPPAATKDESEEARILYVALTRAREKLGIPGKLLSSLRSLSVSNGKAQIAQEDDGF